MARKSTRPDICANKSGAELKRWYWLKQELVEACKAKSVSYAGTKFEILDRLARALDGQSTAAKRNRTRRVAVPA